MWSARHNFLFGCEHENKVLRSATRMWKCDISGLPQGSRLLAGLGIDSRQRQNGHFSEFVWGNSTKTHKSKRWDWTTHIQMAMEPIPTEPYQSQINRISVICAIQSPMSLWCFCRRCWSLLDYCCLLLSLHLCLWLECVELCTIVDEEYGLEYMNYPRVCRIIHRQRWESTVIERSIKLKLTNTVSSSCFNSHDPSIRPRICPATRKRSVFQTPSKLHSAAGCLRCIIISFALEGWCGEHFDLRSFISYCHIKILVFLH